MMLKVIDGQVRILPDNEKEPQFHGKGIIELIYPFHDSDTDLYYRTEEAFALRPRPSAQPPSGEEPSRRTESYPVSPAVDPLGEDA